MPGNLVGLSQQGLRWETMFLSVSKEGPQVSSFGKVLQVVKIKTYLRTSPHPYTLTVLKNINLLFISQVGGGG
jgi:hypothetical protein